MLLEATNVHIAYGDAPAVWDATLHVEEGEIVSVIGPNGAGKSTLINAIAGLLRWKKGSIVFGGVDLADIPPHRVCHQGIALVPEGRRLFTSLTVEENLEIGGFRPDARKHTAEGLQRVYELFPMVHEKRDQLAGSLSGGQQQMVAIGRALMARPRLLLLDEPSLGLAPSVVSDVFRAIEAIHGEGVSILLVEQNVAMALDIANRAYVLEDGHIVAEGAPADLTAQSSIREAYLGL
jgi:branched-chain amino acid transport system ATP-binding protein